MIKRRLAGLHVAYVFALGLMGWVVTIILTVDPPTSFRPFAFTWELPACLMLMTLARMLAFRVFRRVRIALDSMFYIAAVFVYGSLSTAWLVLITLTLDAAINVARDRGVPIRGEAPWHYTAAWIIHNGGLPALVFSGLGWFFNDSTLYPLADTTLVWKFPLFYMLFLTVHYFLAGSSEWFIGTRSRNLIRDFFVKTVTAETILIPLSMAMVLGYMYQGFGLFLLIGASGLIFNVIFRRGALAAEKLRQQVEALSTLNKVGRIIAGSLERPTLMTNLAKETLRMVGHNSRFMLGLVDEKSGIVHYDVFSESGELFKQMAVDRSQGLSGWVMKNRSALNLGDVQKEWPLYLSDYAYNDPDYHSWLGVPLIFYDEVLGVLSVQSTDKYVFSAEHMQTLNSIADQAAVAIENSRLYEMATVDGLTGLFVRRHFDQRIVEEWDRAVRYGAPLAVGLLDLDKFKELNDTHGHQAGDYVLRAAAATVKANMRSFDISARYGGEEFVFILPRTSVDEAAKVAERVRGDIEKMVINAQGRNLKVTASIGIAGFPCDDVNDAWGMVERADRALYDAKKGGRNRVIVADDRGGVKHISSAAV